MSIKQGQLTMINKTSYLKPKLVVGYTQFICNETV